MKPIFCSEESSPLGGFLSTDEEVRQQAIKLRRKPKLAHKIDRIYFHGSIERLIGYDIVNFVDGEIPYLENASVTDCVVVLPNGENVDAVIVAARKDGVVNCLIVSADEVAEAKKALWRKFPLL